MRAFLWLLFAFFCSFLALDVWALHSECVRSGVRREIKIVWDENTTFAGCRVMYRKPDEGLNQFRELWQSQYEPDFCQRKFDELIEQLGKWGFACRKL